MDDRRRAPNPNSPVQPAKVSFVPYLVLGVVGLGLVWSLQDVWVDPFEAPYSTGPQQAPPKADSSANAGAERSHGKLASLFSADDYPVDAQMRGEQGTVGVRIQIDPEGKVSGCDVVQSSGSQSLDTTTCKILQERARFSPARDENGTPVSDTYSQRITWVLRD